MDRLDKAIVEAACSQGFPLLKEEQALEFMLGKDVFAILPTGYGKTTCFSCLPFAFNLYENRSQDNNAIIIVISPLTALIRDQVQGLLKRNVNAGYLCSESTADVIQNVRDGAYSIVYMSPELLVEKWRSLFSTLVYKNRFVGLIVDEANCVVKW